MSLLIPSFVTDLTNPKLTTVQWSKRWETQVCESYAMFTLVSNLKSYHSQDTGVSLCWSLHMQTKTKADLDDRLVSLSKTTFQFSTVLLMTQEAFFPDLNTGELTILFLFGKCFRLLIWVFPETQTLSNNLHQLFFHLSSEHLIQVT